MVWILLLMFWLASRIWVRKEVPQGDLSFYPKVEPKVVMYRVPVIYPNIEPIKEAQQEDPKERLKREFKVWQQNNRLLFG